MAKTKKATDSRTEPRDPRKWTVMVYMAANKNADLDAIAVQDLREMERGANDSAHVVVQINRAWPDSFQRYEVRGARNGQRRGSSFFLRSSIGPPECFLPSSTSSSCGDTPTGLASEGTTTTS